MLMRRGRLNVLGIGAHPDDLEISCGGTLARYAELGHNVSMAYVTRGELGHYTIEPEELGKIRKREARSAASVLGAKFIWMDLPDGMLFHNRENRLKFIDVIRETGANVIITHDPTDYHPDHKIVNELVFAASLLSTVPHIKTAHPPLKKVPVVYCMETYLGVSFNPEEYVDISRTIERKLRALSQHESQLRWLREHSGIDIIESTRVISRFRGFQAGVNYAEGFRLSKRRSNISTRRLLP